MEDTFLGSEAMKMDAKGRVSIPKDFRPVINDCDPKCEDGKTGRFVIVYGNASRDYLECRSLAGMEVIKERIKGMRAADPNRKKLENFYFALSMQMQLDDTGRIVMPKKLREKLGLGETDTLQFVGRGDTFQIWKEVDYAAIQAAEEADTFDPEELL